MTVRPARPLCIVCGCGLVPKHQWATATDQDRARWRAEGAKAGDRVDMCGTCRMRLYRQGQLDQYPTAGVRPDASVPVDPRNPWTHCARCGTNERHTGGLCTDCVETVAVMGERNRWVA